MMLITNLAGAQSSSALGRQIADIALVSGEIESLSRIAFS